VLVDKKSHVCSVDI